MTRTSAFVFAAAALVAAAPVSAQVLGLPVVNNGVPTGLALGADIGFANEAAGKATTIGASAALGVGLAGVSVGVSRWNPETGDAVWSQGGAATVRLFGGPLVPFRITLQGGLARWEINDVSTTHVPVSIGLAATIPNPAFAIKPWIAPRLDYSRTAGDGTTHLGVSGGIELAMLNGFALRASYDRLFSDGVKPGIFAIGIGFAP